MPEYLAPAVFVEEVSFRSKPLEGVSTSTTAFIGPTITGPINDIPELITGVGDFERVYGGTTRLGFGVNYMAHAVRAFFDNGGRRLYVARAFEAASEEDDGVARGGPLPGPAAPNVSLLARFPGSAGNGRLQFFEKRVPTSSSNRRPLERAPLGTMIRTGVAGPATTPATLVGGNVPFLVPDGAVLSIAAGTSAPLLVTFTGQAAQVTSEPIDFVAPLVVTAASAPLVVVLGTRTQTLNVPGTYTSIQGLADALNRALIGGFVVAASADTLTLGHEVRGRDSSVRVVSGGVYGFADEVTASRGQSGDTVRDLGRVSADDIAALLSALPVSVTVGVNGALRISTVAAGAVPAAALTVADSLANPSAAAALGLAVGTVTGTGTSVVEVYVKRATGYQTASGNALPLPSVDLQGVEFLSLNVVAVDAEGRAQNVEDLAYSPDHPRYVARVLAQTPPRRSDELENRFALSVNADESILAWPFTLRSALLGGATEAVRELTGGNDGVAPTTFDEPLERLKSLEEISIVAAPGSSARSDLNVAKGLRNELVVFVERNRAYQIAVLDTPPQQVVGQVRDYRGEIDSKYAALYYPWVRIPNPDQKAGDITIPRELDVPPSGFICGIYARNDAERGVHKAPANEVIRGALSLEAYVNFAQQELLNPSGINALRFFPGRGFRVWGARVASSDPEWKYVSLRRYFNYVEASIDRGTQWVVFEPNGPRLWQRVRSTVSDFLFTEWRNGALLGNAPAEAFFVRVDRTTMTQNDLDNGRLIVEVGIAPVNPAEFVIFRIGQKTSDGRS